jgi:hypothetical protein
MSYSQAVKKQMNPMEMMNMMMAQFNLLAKQNETLLKEREELQKRLDDAQSDARSFEEVDIIPTLLNVISTVKPVNVTSALAHTFLQALAHSSPDRFKQWGGIHHDDSGTRTYISVRFYTDPEMEKRYNVLHVYLFLRGHTKKITSIEMYNKDEKQTIEFNPDWKHEE